MSVVKCWNVMEKEDTGTMSSKQCQERVFFYVLYKARGYMTGRAATQIPLPPWLLTSRWVLRAIFHVFSR